MNMTGACATIKKFKTNLRVTSSQTNKDIHIKSTKTTNRATSSLHNVFLKIIMRGGIEKSVLASRVLPSDGKL